MHFADILSFCFSILGLYVLVHYLRFLIPRNLLPHVSAVLAEAEHLRYRAESIGVSRMSIRCLSIYETVLPYPTDGHLLDRQLFQSISEYSDGKPSCSWNITANSAYCSVRSNVQVVYTLVASRGN